MLDKLFIFMKILLATSTITPLAGISAFNRELCNVLSKKNIVHLMCYENIKEYVNCEKTIPLPYYSLNRISDVVKLLDIIRAERYDIIINSNSKIIAILSPYLNDDTKIISISHSLRYTESDVSAFNAPYIDGIVALSYYNKEYLKKKFSIKEDKIKVIYNFVTPYEDSDAIRSRKKKEDKINIVYAGGTASSKSPELVIKVLNKLLETDLNFTFYFLGVKSPPLKSIQPFKSINSIVTPDERVIMPGKVPSNQAREIIANANIFFAPSRREGCPMALLEALRVGTIPIVADYKIANRELIEDGISGFIIDHKNISLFVNRIEDIIRNPSKYKSVYDNSYKLFTEKLTYDVWYEGINNFLKDDRPKHKKRLPGFSSIRYRFYNIKFCSMDFLNKLHLFFHESLPAALPIMMMYIKGRK